jgi:hypothetical protein
MWTRIRSLLSGSGGARASVSPNEKDLALVAPQQVGVFVSYNHRDRMIADALVESIKSLTSNIVVFIDHSGLETSDDYEEKISAAIRQSQWFVIVCSGSGKPEKDMSWCYYETGQFRAKLEASDQIRSVRERICYLYDNDRPSQLARYQGCFVTTKSKSDKPLDFENESDDSIEYERTDLFAFFTTLLGKSAPVPLAITEDQVVRKNMRNAVRKLINAFVRNGSHDIVGEEVFQPRISFDLPPYADGTAHGLGSESVITGEYKALPDIFGIVGTTASWADIKAKTAGLGEGVAPLWVEDLEKASRRVEEGLVPIQTDFLCLGKDGQFYRPIIARYEKYRGGGKKCYVGFIPSRNRRFSLSFKASLLLSALILSVRFRQRVLPVATEIEKAAGAPELKKAELLQKLQSEITLVEGEAVEFGLQPPRDEHDEPTLLNSFRDGPDKEALRSEIIRWASIRKELLDSIAAARNPSKEATWSDAADVAVKDMAGMLQVNSLFVEKLCNELLHVEQVETGGTTPGG